MFGEARNMQPIPSGVEKWIDRTEEFSLVTKKPSGGTTANPLKLGKAGSACATAAPPESSPTPSAAHTPAT
ncbi:hypothetical protein MASB_08710 [Mycobacteroides abscessus subsp. bolletii BD]|nr:hypothetical protein MASB_08710 [Mycobacteroides abscessus subsp. bolletii BD]